MIKQIVLLYEFYNPFFNFAVYYAVVCIAINTKIQTFFFNHLGTDIAGICDSLKDKVQCRLVPVNTSGLGADYSAGLRKIYLQLAELFVQPDAAKQSKRYNILGASLLHYRAESDICEIARLLREGFDYELLHCFAMNTTTEALAELGSAELNIVLTNEAVPCAEYLQSVTGTPFVYLPPYGYSQTTEFLKSVAAVINKPVKEAVLQRLEEKNRRLKMNSRYCIFKGRL